MVGSCGRARRGASSLALTAIVAVSAHAATPEPVLQFQIVEGSVLNAFYQQGSVAAHLLLSDGTRPRVLVAFPAGNSGVGVWFENVQRPVRWTLGNVRAVSRADARGRMLHGIAAEASVDGALVVHEAVLGSVRVLRDFQIERAYPPELKSVVEVSDDSARWTRTRLDGAAGYTLAISVTNGSVRGGGGEPVTLSARGGDPLRLTITALTGETPLTPLGGHLLETNAADDVRSRQVLRFLSYEEKFLAGSWRFDTYFGRDTLMSLRLLMPVLQPEAVERGLGAVLLRLQANGEVAHEEDIGEFAVMRHRKENGTVSDAPIYDYKMIDDDFMLPAVSAAYLTGRGRARAKEFLASRLPNGEPVGAALARNFVWVTRSARPFAEQSQPANLIPLKPGLNVGQWRDSEDGLAGGRYAFDVNAVLAPAAMKGIAELMRSGALTPHLTADQQEELATTDKIAEVWAREAPRLFRLSLPAAEARRRLSGYAASIGVSPTRAFEALPDGDLTINAIALDAQYEPIPIVHSDGGFALLLQDPPASDVEQLVEGMIRPFPAGLLTDAGLLVANPVFADATRQRRFGPTAYHGAVVWSWQQALFAAGLDRQVARVDLPAATIKRLQAARRQLWSVIRTTRELRASELWSWRYADGRYQAVPFGQRNGDADESNAAQLWSTVYLAIPAEAR